MVRSVADFLHKFFILKKSPNIWTQIYIIVIDDMLES